MKIAKVGTTHTIWKIKISLFLIKQEEEQQNAYHASADV